MNLILFSITQGASSFLYTSPQTSRFPKTPSKTRYWNTPIHTTPIDILSAQVVRCQTTGYLSNTNLERRVK